VGVRARPLSRGAPKGTGDLRDTSAPITSSAWSAICPNHATPDVPGAWEPGPDFQTGHRRSGPRVPRFRRTYQTTLVGLARFVAAIVVFVVKGGRINNVDQCCPEDLRARYSWRCPNRASPRLHLPGSSCSSLPGKPGARPHQPAGDEAAIDVVQVHDVTETNALSRRVGRHR